MRGRHYSFANGVGQCDGACLELILEQGDSAKTDSGIGEDRIQRGHDPSKPDTALGCGPYNAVRNKPAWPRWTVGVIAIRVEMEQWKALQPTLRE